MRSMGYQGQTDEGDMSLYLVQDRMDLVNYQGLRVRFANDDGQPGVKVYMNDGKGPLTNDQFIGSWVAQYQGSNVPTTLKIGYSSKGFLKMTLDNILMFETDKIRIPFENYRFGIVAATSADKLEQFEILRLKTYDELTDGILARCKETLYPKHQTEPVQRKATKNFNDQFERLRDEFHREQQQLQSGQQGGQQLNQRPVYDEGEFKSIRMDIQRVQELAKAALATELNEIKALKDEIDNVNFRLESMMNLFKRQFELMDSYDSRMGSIDKVLKSQLDKSDSISERFNKLAFAKQAEKVESHTSSGAGWHLAGILVAIVALLVVLSLLIFKLRNDIRHFKVL